MCERRNVESKGVAPLESASDGFGRRRTSHQISAATSNRKTNPPITPPTIAPSAPPSFGGICSSVGSTTVESADVIVVDTPDESTNVVESPVVVVIASSVDVLLVGSNGLDCDDADETATLIDIDVGELDPVVVVLSPVDDDPTIVDAGDGGRVIGIGVGAGVAAGFGTGVGNGEGTGVGAGEGSGVGRGVGDGVGQ